MRIFTAKNAKNAKSFLLCALCVLCGFSSFGQPPSFQRNSLNTNILGTNLFWNPSLSSLHLSGASPNIIMFNTSGSVDKKSFAFASYLDSLYIYSITDAGVATAIGVIDNLGHLILLDDLSLNAKTNRLKMSSTNTLLFDGVPVVTGGANFTNTIINATTINVSNLNVTNLTAQTINITTNTYNVGKGGHLYITNDVTPAQVGANKLAGTEGNGILTNVTLSGDVTTSSGGLVTTIANNAVTYAKMQDVSATARAIGRNTAGSGDPEEITGTQILDWIGSVQGSILYRNGTVWTALPPNTAGYVLTDGGAGANPSWAAAGGGSTGSTNYRSAVITLTMTTTNVDASQINWLSTNQCYRLILTTNAFFSDAVCINVPNTNSFQWLQLDILQDGTGGRTVTFTNSIYAGVNGTFPITLTANSWDSCALINSRQTNGNVAVLPSNNLRR